MEFNGGRMKLPRDFGGETARMHEDELVEAARHGRDAGRASQRRRWRFQRYHGRHAAHA
jgi:hypothetical protein